MNEWTSSVCAVVGTRKAASDAMAMFRFDLAKMYSRVRNKHTPKLIIFGFFSRGYILIKDLKDLYFTT